MSNLDDTCKRIFGDRDALSVKTSVSRASLNDLLLAKDQIIDISERYPNSSFRVEDRDNKWYIYVSGLIISVEPGMEFSVFHDKSERSMQEKAGISFYGKEISKNVLLIPETFRHYYKYTCDKYIFRWNDAENRPTSIKSDRVGQVNRFALRLMSDGVPEDMTQEIIGRMSSNKSSWLYQVSDEVIKDMIKSQVI